MTVIVEIDKEKQDEEEWAIIYEGIELRFRGQREESEASIDTKVTVSMSFI